MGATMAQLQALHRLGLLDPESPPTFDEAMRLLREARSGDAGPDLKAAFKARVEEWQARGWIRPTADPERLAALLAEPVPTEALTAEERATFEDGAAAVAAHRLFLARCAGVPGPEYVRWTESDDVIGRMAWHTESGPIADIKASVQPARLNAEPLVVGPSQAANMARAERWARMRYEVLGGYYPTWDEMPAKARETHVNAMLPILREVQEAERKARPTRYIIADPGVVRVETPQVATLPDGTTIALPAGTVLREGEGGQAYEPTIINRREPRPTCCEAAARCSALNWQPLVPSWQMTWGCIQHCPFCGTKLAAPGEPQPPAGVFAPTAEEVASCAVLAEVAGKTERGAAVELGRRLQVMRREREGWMTRVDASGLHALAGTLAPATGAGSSAPPTWTDDQVRAMWGTAGPLMSWEEARAILAKGAASGAERGREPATPREAHTAPAWHVAKVDPGAPMPIGVPEWATALVVHADGRLEWRGERKSATD
jgi:hypothetical protein